MSYGDAEGRPQSWLDERFVQPPQGSATGWTTGTGFPAPNRREFAERIYRAVDQILTNPCPHQIVVTHGFALTFVVAAWIGMPLEATGFVAVKSTSGGITLLSEDEVFHNRGIVSLNDTSRLMQAETPLATYPMSAPVSAPPARR